MNKPVLLVVDDDAQVLAALRRDLRTRYRETYGILSASSGEECLSTIRELKVRGDSLAIVISDQRMPGIQGVDVLAQSRDLYPLARRVLLTAYSDIDAAINAINHAHLDHYLSKPWSPPEECLFPVVDDLLDCWQAEYLPEAKGLRVLGQQWSSRSHAIKDFLASNLIPYRWLDIERNPDAQTMLDAAGIDASQLPALLFEDGTTMVDPEPRQVAERLGRPLSAALELYDLVIVGAGPSGLAAAVYGASEGLRTLLLDRHAPGGQAGTSSRIENYLGFPSGVSGSELTRRAVTQAQRLGAEFLVPLEVRKPLDPRRLQAPHPDRRTHHRHEDYPRLHRHGISRTHGPRGAGPHRCRRVLRCRHNRSTRIQQPASAHRRRWQFSRAGRDVPVPLRAGSPDRGAARIFEQHHVALLGGTDRTKSQNPRPALRGTPSGSGRWASAGRSLEQADGTIEQQEIDAVFIFIGTRPRSGWMPEGVLRDTRGFVLTGKELSTDPRFTRTWKERREPLPLETSAPGVFAAGDIRAGAMNRVASAVGEGAMAVRFVHDYLALT